MQDQLTDTKASLNQQRLTEASAQGVPVQQVESKGGGRYEAVLPHGDFGFINVTFPLAPSEFKADGGHAPGYLKEIDVVIEVPTDSRGVIFLGEYGRLDDPDYQNRREAMWQYHRNIDVALPREPVKYPDLPEHRDRRILLVLPDDQPIWTALTTNRDDFLAVGQVGLSRLRAGSPTYSEMYDRETGFELTTGQVVEMAGRLTNQK